MKLSKNAKIIMFASVDKDNMENVYGMGPILKLTGLSETEYFEACKELIAFGLIENYSSAEGKTIIFKTTPNGRKQVFINFEEEKPSIEIGTYVHGDVWGGNIQGVGVANYSEVNQAIGTDAAEIRRAIDATLNQLMDSLSSELDLKQKVYYAELIRQFQDEVSKEKPDPGVLQKFFTGIFGYISGLSSAIDSVEKLAKIVVLVGPYLQTLADSLLQLFKAK